MTDDQKELDRKFSCSLDTLNFFINRMRCRETGNDDEATFPDMLENALNVFLEVHRQWREHIGDPINTPFIVANFLRGLADDIEFQHHVLEAHLHD